MATRVKEEPDFLPGLAKDFLVPYSVSLTRAEQQLRETIKGNELAGRSVNESKALHSEMVHQRQVTQVAVFENERLRSVTEQQVAPALRDIALGQREIAETGKKSSLTLEDIRDLADEASYDRRGIRSATETTVRHTGELVKHSVASARRGEMALLQRDQLISGVSHLESTAQYYGERQVREMVAAQSIRVEQLASLRALTESSDVGNALLDRIDRSINNLGGVVQEQFSHLNVGVEHIRDLASGLLSKVAEMNNNLESIEKAVLNVGETIEQSIMEQIANDTRIGEEIKIAIYDAGKSIHRYLDAMQQAILHPERIKSQEQIDIANSLIKRGKYSQAITYLDRAETGWPDNPFIYEQRAWCHTLSEKPVLAETNFKEAIELADGESNKETKVRNRLHLANLYYNEARVYKRNGFLQLQEDKLIQALEVSRIAVDEMPSNGAGRFALATYLAELKLYEEAVDELTMAIAQNPEVMKYVASVEAFQPLEACLKHTVDSIHRGVSLQDIQYAIAKDYLEMGNAENCFNWMAQVLESDRDYFASREFWKDDVFVRKNKEFKKHLIEQIEAAEPSEWYAVATLALQFPGIGQKHIDKVMSL